MGYKSSLKYKIDLVKTFNATFSDKSREVKDVLRKHLSSTKFKSAYGEEIINRIIERTSKESIDRNGSSFRKYSASYRKSQVFKMYNKTSKVNLELTGEMLSSMETETTKDTVSVRFVDEINAAKAHGNIYENGRNFLGLPKSEEQSIMRELIVGLSLDELEEKASDFTLEVSNG